MKTIILFIILISELLFAQQFEVTKIMGIVMVQKGMEENFVPIKKGDTLNITSLVLTKPNSFVQLSNKKNTFILKSNSALGLKDIRKISINDLLLVIAMEEIRNVSPKNSSGVEKNTAVYGKEVSAKITTTINESELGTLKINGAKQLAQNGYPKSAIIVSKDVFRKYPATNSNFENRLYFAKLFKKLNLNNELLDELNSIKKIKLTKEQLEKLDSLIAEINVKLVNNG